MAFPAMKIADWLQGRMALSDRAHNVVQILLTILLSLGIGLFLKFA